MGVRFTSGVPFVMRPHSDAFHRELSDFAAIRRVVARMRQLRIGVFGARTTAFKSVRYDEIAMERHGVDTEALDFSQVLARFEQTETSGAAIESWREQLHATCDMRHAPQGTDVTLARLGLAFECIIGDMALDAVAIRCWSELQQSLRITPCAVMGVLNQRGVPAVCETDVTNALLMMALCLAGEGPVGCMDIYNNYGDDPEKCILFHCGPLPLSLMRGPGTLGEQKMFQKTMGQNCSWGVNLARAKAGQITLGGGRTENNEVQFYVENGEITDDPVEEAFFGTCGVLRLPGLQTKLMHLSEAGFRHHAVYTMGDRVRAVCEALEKYLDYRRMTL